MDAKKKPYIEDNADGSKTLHLRKPLTISGAEVSALRMREPLVKDNLAAAKVSGDDSDRELFAFASLCGVAPTDLHQLPTKEYKLLAQAYVAFHD